MAAKARVTVFMTDNAFPPSVSRTFLLYGRERCDKNADKTIYVEEVVPMNESAKSGNDSNETANEYKHDGVTRDSKRYILGLVCNSNSMDNERMCTILKQKIKSSSFSILVIPINEIWRGKWLVLIQQTPFEHGNIGDIPKTEIRIACVKRNLRRSQLSWLHLDEPLGGNEKLFEHYLKGSIYARDHYSSGQTGSHKQNISSIFQLLSLLLLSVPWFLNMVQLNLKVPSILKQFLGFSTKYLFVAKQLSYRIDKLYDMCVASKENSKRVYVGPKSITNGNLVVSLVIDIILGFLVVYFVFSNEHCLSISTWLIGQKYNVAEQLLNLLKWLMGAPAGLKLNIPLNQFLGNFYTYHVYLWTNYLYFIEAYLPTIILCCTLAGCLGLTFLLSLLCDVLSLLTIHIYCFYIYAARLFCLEIHVLSSLLRLFTGKKWNILHGRVDSVEYDMDRLFIGTLLFTILLFLFPTVFLYYIVFTSLRLLVLLVQSFLYCVVSLLNSFPFFGLWLYFVNPERLPGQIIVDTKTINCSPGLEDCFSVDNIRTMQPDYCLYLSFRHKCLPCGNLFRNCTSDLFETTYLGIFGEGIFKKILTGQIISKQ